MAESFFILQPTRGIFRKFFKGLLLTEKYIGRDEKENKYSKKKFIAYTRLAEKWHILVVVQSNSPW